MRETDYTDPLHQLYDRMPVTSAQEALVYDTESQCYAYSDRPDIQRDIASTALAELVSLQTAEAQELASAKDTKRRQNFAAIRTVYIATRSAAKVDS